MQAPRKRLAPKRKACLSDYRTARDGVWLKKINRKLPFKNLRKSTCCAITAARAYLMLYSNGFARQGKENRA